MKKVIFIGLVLFVMPATLFAANVAFVIEELKYNDGRIQVGIFDKAETFPDSEKRLKGCLNQGELKDNRARVECELEPGKYAAAIFHDRNNNGDLDKNFMGIPKEGYGFSNNARGTFGPPDFQEAVFSVENDDIEMIIRLQY